MQVSVIVGVKLCRSGMWNGRESRAIEDKKGFDLSYRSAVWDDMSVNKSN